MARIGGRLGNGHHAGPSKPHGTAATSAAPTTEITGNPRRAPSYCRSACQTPAWPDPVNRPGRGIGRHTMPVALCLGRRSEIFRPKTCSRALIQHARDRANQVQYLPRVAVHAVDIIADPVISLVRVESITSWIPDDPVVATDHVAAPVSADLTRRHAGRVFLG